MKYLIVIMLHLLSSSVMSAGNMSGGTITFVLPSIEKTELNKHKSLKRVVKKLVGSKSLSNMNTEILAASDIENLKDIDNRYFVAVTEKAALELAKSTSFLKAQVIFSDSEFMAFDGQYSYIYSVPDPKRQVLLARTLFGYGKKCALFTSDVNGESEIFKKAALSYSMKLEVVNTKDFDSEASLSRHVSGINCGIIQRSPNPFPHFDLVSMIERLYKKNYMGVIANSPRLIKSTASVGATYSSLDSIANAIVKGIEVFSESNVYPKSSFTSEFEITVNWYMQRSLNLFEGDSSEIRSKIKAINLKQELGQIND